MYLFSQNYVGIIAPHIPHHLMHNAESLGIQLAKLLIEKGASEILKEARKNVAL